MRYAVLVLALSLSGCMTVRSTARDISIDTFTDKSGIQHVVNDECVISVTKIAPGWTEFSKMQARMIFHKRDRSEGGGLDAAMDDKFEELKQNPEVAKAIVTGVVQGVTAALKGVP